MNEIENIKFELKRLINCIYNHVDGFSSKFKMEQFAKELDKKYFSESYAGDINVKEFLLNQKQEEK